MKSWLKRWREPWRFIFGILTLVAILTLVLAVSGIIHLELLTGIVILLLGLLAYEATI